VLVERLLDHNNKRPKAVSSFCCCSDSCRNSSLVSSRPLVLLTFGAPRMLHRFRFLERFKMGDLSIPLDCRFVHGLGRFVLRDEVSLLSLALLACGARFCTCNCCACFRRHHRRSVMDAVCVERKSFCFLRCASEAKAPRHVYHQPTGLVVIESNHEPVN